ncbi:MAG: hypothetical protein ACJ8FY_23825 [Gemmataceae bacterium]
MLKALPQPEVVRCYFDNGFTPRLPAMCLRWDLEANIEWEGVWDFPQDVQIAGPAPERFGISIQRWAEDSYAVRLLWNFTCLSWACLTRSELLESALSPLLEAMGTDLWYLLDQPVGSDWQEPNQAA